MHSISIILPVYNVSLYLSRCLDSIFVDNHFVGQVICVNDGSTDNSLTILQDYANQYNNLQIINQPNLGPGEARNAGLRAATGDYVMFIDSDDWLFEGQLDKVFSRIDAEDVIYFNAKKFYEQTSQYDPNIDIDEYKNMDGMAYFVAILDKPRNMPCVCVGGGIYRRMFLIDNGLWSEPKIYHEDELYTPQVLIKAQKVSSVNICLYAYRIRSGSITGSITPKHIKDALFATRKLNEIYHTYSNLPIGFYNNLSNYYLDILSRAVISDLPLRRWWKMNDSKLFYRYAKSNHIRRVAILSFVSFRMAYKFHTDQLPSIVRRLMNRFL